MSSSDEKDLKKEIEHVELGHMGQPLDAEEIQHRKEMIAQHGDVDLAAKILEEAGSVEWSDQDDKRVLRMIDIYVMIPMAIVYFCQQLDKSSLSYSATFGIQTQIGLKGTEYQWLSSCVYVAQLIVQPISSYAIVKLNLRYWLVFNMAGWGISLICSAAAHNFTNLLIGRIFLGGFEATLAPTFIALCQMWWRRREQTWRVIGWNISNSLAGIVGPLIAYGISHAQELLPYQNIFLILGALTLALVPVVYGLLPASPSDARFLRHGNDRVIALERLRDNNQGSEGSRKWKWEQVTEAFTDPKSYIWCLILFCCAFPSGGIGTFLGLLIKGLGFTAFNATLLTIPPAVIGLIFLLAATWLTTRFKVRGPVIMGLCLFAIAGNAALRLLPISQTNSRLGAFYIGYAYAALQPLCYAWATVSISGSTKKSVVVAMLFVAQCVGNIGGPFVYYTSEAPVYQSGITSDIILWAALFLLCALQIVLMMRLNRRNAKRREAMGRIGDKVDASLLTPAESQAYHKKLAEDMRAAGLHANIDEDAFLDLTDLQNPDFIYPW